MDNTIKTIKESIKKFNLNLEDKIVCTEAATGNYVVTPIIAALAGAKVWAITKNSKYGSIEEVKSQTYKLADKFNISNKIIIVSSYDELEMDKIDILTNTGFNRPINKSVVNKLSSNCVIPLMWEPWEWRKEELDLQACYEKGIKVYGTNESDKRLKTMDYIGYIALYLLLKQKLTPFSSKILIVGCEKFASPIAKILKNNNYNYKSVTVYNKSISNIAEYNAIIIAENSNNLKIIGNNESFINNKEISEYTVVIHIAGNVDFSRGNFIKIPEAPAHFGYMSFTTDYIDSKAIIDLHAAGLKVAEGMLKANQLGLKGTGYKNFMENNYAALSFENKKYW